MQNQYCYSQKNFKVLIGNLIVMSVYQYLRKLQIILDRITLKMTCSFCSMVSLRKMISLSFSLRTVSMSDTAESDGDGVWFISDEDDEPTSNWRSKLIHYFIAPLDRKSWTNLTIIIYETNHQCSVLLFLSFIHLK